MLQRIFGLATALALVAGWGSAASAQGYATPGFGGMLVAPNGELTNLSGASRAGVLRPAFYAAEFLTPSPSHPWVMAPRYNSYLPWTTGLGWGFSTSPYGDYSRYVYWKAGTGIFPGVERPFLRVENDHWHQKTKCCP